MIILKVVRNKKKPKTINKTQKKSLEIKEYYINNQEKKKNKKLIN